MHFRIKFMLFNDFPSYFTIVNKYKIWYWIKYYTYIVYL